MLLGSADLLNRPMRNSEIDLLRRRATFVGRKAETPEQSLSDAVVALVLAEGLVAFEGKPALTPVPLDQTELLKRGHVAKRRRGREFEHRGDLFEGDPSIRGLADPDDLEGFELASGESLECLHAGEKPFGKYKPDPNY